MVIIGAVCLIVAILVGILGRVSGSTVKKVGDETTTKSWPSETLITSLLAVGAVLIIVGFHDVIERQRPRQLGGG